MTPTQLLIALMAGTMSIGIGISFLGVVFIMIMNNSSKKARERATNE